jgi:OOP family OmpA-OmpF porin
LVVGAFTDCIGSDKYNNKLSIKRAQNVVQYLKNKGVGKDKFVLNGYAKSYAITPCDPTSNKRQAN